MTKGQGLALIKLGKKAVELRPVTTMMTAKQSAAYYLWNGQQIRNNRKVKVVVLAVDEKKKRISPSMKQVKG